MQAGQMMDMVVANVIRIQGCLAFFCYYSTTQPANQPPSAFALLRLALVA